MSEETDVNALLSTSFENIEDLPELANFPTGMFLFKCSYAEPTEEGLALMFDFQEIIDVAEENEEKVPPVGSRMYQSWKGKKGLEFFKSAFVDTFEGLGAETPAEFLREANGSEFVITVKAVPDPKKRKDENGNLIYFTNIKKAILA